MSVSVVSFGCRLNGVEAETMRGRAEAAGLRDLVIVNSCAVTAEAVRQSGQAVRRAARERPGARIVATGCAVEVAPDRFRRMPEIGTLLGNAEKMEPDIWRRIGGDAPEAMLGGIAGATGPAQAASDAGANRVRAFVAIQNGCDHACTFCTIPAGRGRSRSASPGAVIEAVTACLDAGAREVVLTGVDITAYGQDLPVPARLGGLVRAILRAVPDLPRLRLSSIDSVEADPDLIEAIGSEPRLMPHLHLSLQAGDDLVLKRMKRRHLRADAIRFCADMKAARPDLVFGADIIAGFPTETEAMFARSLDLVEECGLTHLHVFPFSPRPGSPAARMPAVPPVLVRERAARLRESGEAALARHLEGEIGRVRPVLVEGSGIGRTEGFAPVRFRDPPAKGTLLPVAIAGRTDRELLAA